MIPTVLYLGTAFAIISPDAVGWDYAPIVNVGISGLVLATQLTLWIRWLAHPRIDLGALVNSIGGMPDGLATPADDLPGGTRLSEPSILNAVRWH